MKFKCIKNVHGCFTQNKVYSVYDTVENVIRVIDDKNDIHIISSDGLEGKWLNENFEVVNEEEFKIRALSIDTLGGHSYKFFDNDAELLSNAIMEVGLRKTITKAVKLSDGKVRTFNTEFIVSVQYEYWENKD